MILAFPEFAPLLQARCDIRKIPPFPISPRFRTATCAICYCFIPSSTHFSVFCFATFNHKFIFTHSSSKTMRQKLIRSAGKPKNGYFSPAGPKIWHPGQLNINTSKWGGPGYLRGGGGVVPEKLLAIRNRKKKVGQLSYVLRFGLSKDFFKWIFLRE